MRVYCYSFSPMLLGIAILAAGLKKAIGHLGDPLRTALASALAGGVAVYLAATCVSARAFAFLPCSFAASGRSLFSPRFRWQALRRRPNFSASPLSWS
jgi:hypothetical protein